MPIVIRKLRSAADNAGLFGGQSMKLPFLCDSLEISDLTPVPAVAPGMSRDGFGGSRHLTGRRILPKSHNWTMCLRSGRRTNAVLVRYGKERLSATIPNASALLLSWSNGKCVLRAPRGRRGWTRIQVHLSQMHITHTIYSNNALFEWKVLLYRR